MDNLLSNAQLLAGITPILNDLLAVPNPTPQQLIDIASLQNIITQLNDS